jgi:hypothetical protein
VYTHQSNLTIATATPAVVGALEVAWRAIHPTTAANKGDTSTSSSGYTAV